MAIKRKSLKSFSCPKRLLFFAGCLSMAVAVFQAVISFSPAWSLYFGAPAEIVSNRWLLLVSGLIAAIILGIWGLYGFSGAGFLQRLFLLRLGLVSISVLYILRGVFVLPQLLAYWGFFRSSLGCTLQDIISSSISLTIGLIFAIGTLGTWRDLSSEKDV